MTETLRIEIARALKSRRAEVDFDHLPFGKICTDHMFMVDFQNKEWKNPRIIPFGHIPMSPVSPAIHYGQAIFEGIKAHLSASGEILVFRPQDNLRRMNVSAERMCMPALPEELFMESLRTLIDLDRAWMPRTEGSSLYIRPFMFSADEYIGIRPSENFTFMIVLSPSGAYYSGAVKVKIETHYTRAIAGGTGFVKAGGNYGGSIYPAKLAQEEGFHQLLWTDGKQHKYIEESGTMNVMFVLNGRLVTPELSDSILAGITRDSVLKLARHWGMKVEERKVSVEEIIEGVTSGKLTEAFGTGTAATIAPISVIGYQGNKYTLPEIEHREFSNKVFKELNHIKYGKTEDIFGWIYKI
jgi:branched-chain amino acid aminotransferase